MKSKFNQSIFMAFIAISGMLSFSSCKKDKDDDKKSTVTPQKSKLELLSRTWILKETFEDDVQKTSNGTGKYEFTRLGSFRFESNNIGTYRFNTSDSTSLEVLFNGLSSPMIWKIALLNESTLKTEFTSQGKKYNYNYSQN